MKAIMILFFTLFSFLTVAQDLTEVQKQQLDVNYLINGGFENGKAGWSTYNDGASASPVDGVGGTANITLTTTTTLPHDGKVSGVLTKDAVNRQGQGIKRDFLIPDIAKGKVVRLKFSYEITSGTYTSGDTSVWIYDVTNSRLIQPSAYTIENSGLKESKFVEFQSSIDSNSYRLIVHVTSTSASAYTLKFDSFSVGLTPKVFGSVTTDWKEFTPTFSGLGTVTSIKAFWRKSGDSLEIYGRATTGTPTASGVYIYFTSLGFRIDSSKIISDATHGQICGQFTKQSVATTPVGLIGFRSDVSDAVFVAREPSNGGLRDSDGTAILGNSEKFSFTFKVPIQGWSSSQQLSNDADTRVVAASYGRNSSQSINASSDTTLIANVKNIDTHGAYNTSNGRYYCISSGVYNVSASVFFTASATTGVRQLRLTKRNSSGGVTEDRYLDTFNKTNTNNEEISLRLTAKIQCNMGESLEIVAWTNASGVSTIAGILFMDFEKLSGPSQIAASETVAVRATSSSGQSIAATSGSTVIFGSKNYDTHNAYNAATGVFTAPISGKYKIDSIVSYSSATYTVGGRLVLYLYVNGSNYSELDRKPTFASSPPVTSITGSDTVNLLQGETVYIVTDHSESTARTLTATATQNRLTITRIGNY